MKTEYNPSLSIYMEQINRSPLLTAIEEQTLSRKMLAGGRGSKEARQHFIESNLRFVVKLSRMFMHQGLSQMDLIQEGNIGLIEAVDRFDPELGFRFSTFSAYWIRQAMQRAISKKARTIRLPVRKHHAVARMEYLKGKFYLQYGRYPKDNELAKLLDVKVSELKQLMDSKDATLSLESPVAEENAELNEFIEDKTSLSPSNEAITLQLKEKLNIVLHFLSEREQKILMWRFGFIDGKRVSLRKISQYVGLSQEGVRRIEKEAINKLRRPALRAQLEGLL